MTIDILTPDKPTSSTLPPGIADTDAASLAEELEALREAAAAESGRNEFIEGFRWPEGVRMAVNFTADYDAMLFRRVLEEPSLQLAKGEFGGRVGLRRLVKLFNAHEVKATFFTPGRICELYPASLAEAIAGGHELADHMWEHRTPEGTHWQRDHVARTIAALTPIRGSAPVGSRSYYPHAVLKEAGFLYNSHGSAASMPYYMGDAEGGNVMVELPMHLAINDAQFFTFGWIGSEPQAQRLADPERVLELWWEAFQHEYEKGGYLNILLHPYVSGRALRIAMLEELIQRMKRCKGVWFPTCETVARYCLDKFPPRSLRP